MSKSKSIPATSKDVRAWFEKNPKRIPAGAEVSVAVSCKGRISVAAIEVYNKANKDRPYSEGQKPTVEVTYKAKNHRMVTVHKTVAEIRALAGEKVKRGPLGRATIEAAGAALRG